MMLCILLNSKYYPYEIKSFFTVVNMSIDKDWVVIQ